MTDPSQVQNLEGIIAQYGLSERAARSSLQDSPWDAIEKLLSNIWTADNPDGLVFLGVAENPFMHQEVAAYMTKNLTVEPKEHLTYGVGPRGSPLLRKALASFFTVKFESHEPVLPSEIVILPGVVAVIDALTWSICNEDEGIIVPLPFYTGFKPAVSERARGVLIPAAFQSIEGYKDLNDVFDPEMNRRALDNALLNAKRDGIKARAVMISNPHNPLGRCYPTSTLKEIARFCGRNNLHLVVDQIFAMSVYENAKVSETVPFTSITSLDLSDHIDRSFVHTAYGMGKDFSATGLRVGALHSRNDGLLRAVSNISVFGWVPYVNQDIWAKMLDDEPFLSRFLHKSRQVLSKQCNILCTFLEERDIPYYAHVNAGVFVWVDLRRYLHDYTPRGDEADEDSTVELSSADTASYRERETELFKRCLAGGVGISPGTSFSTEELGWFRISFNVEESALRVGLERLLKCLQAVEANA